MSARTSSLVEARPAGHVDIDAQIDRIEADGAIDLATVDFTAPDPRRVRDELGPALDYFARIEREVERNVLELQVVLPRADDRTKRFVTVWEMQELPHGAVFDRMQEEVGLPPAVPELNDISRTLHVAGLLSHVPGVHEALMFLYLSIGAMHERLTAVGYDRLRERVLELGMTGSRRPRSVRSARRSPCTTPTTATPPSSSAGPCPAWQLQLARVVRTHTYRPVGATTPERQADFGAATVALFGAQDVAPFAGPVQRVADELLASARQGLRLPPFVAAALRECVDLHLARQAATA